MSVITCVASPSFKSVKLFWEAIVILSKTILEANKSIRPSCDAHRRI